MDPFSFASSILGTVEVLSKATLVVAKYASAVKDAQKSRQHLLAELSTTTQTLTSLKILIDDLNVDNESPLPEVLTLSFSALDGGDGYLAQCRKTVDELLELLQRNGTGKMNLGQRLMWPLTDQKKIEGYMKKLERQKTQFTLALSIASGGMLGKLVDSTAGIANEQQRVKIEKEESDNKRKLRKSIDSLDGASYATKHRSSARVRQENTCGWLFKNTLFNQWMDWSTSFIWLYGIPGSGKTTLTSAVIDHLLASASDEAIIYHYCDFRDPKSTSVLAILRSLLSFFLQDKAATWDWIDEIPELENIDSSTSSPLSNIDELYGLVIKATKNYARVTFVLDALDECTEFGSFAPLLSQLCGSCLVPARIFVTSRREQAIVDAFASYPFISLKDEAENVYWDIETHVQAEIRKQPKLSRLPAALKDEIVDVLLSKADGMFRWVQCQLDFITSCRTPKGVKAALQDLPAGLYETYARILVAIDAEGREVSTIAKRILVWLVGTLSPITLPQVVEAIMIQPSQQCLDEDMRVFQDTDVLDICRSLVDYDERDQTVRLSHFTVQEYLVGHNFSDTAAIAHFRLEMARIHRDLALLTVTYLLLSDFSSGPCPDEPSYTARQTSHPFLRYAALHWYSHVSGTEEPDEEVFQCVQDFCSNEQNHLAFRQIYESQDGTEKRFKGGLTFPGLPYYAIRYSFRWIFPRILDSDPGIAARSIPGWGAPMMYAALCGNIDAIRLLVAHGASVDAPSKDWRWSKEDTPLLISIEQQKTGSIETLIAAGADVNLGAEHSKTTPLHAAAVHAQPSIVELLLRKGARIHAVDAEGKTPLHSAVLGSSKEAVRILLEAGCDLEALTNAQRTALALAFDLRLRDIIEFLLSKGADIKNIRGTRLPYIRWASSEPWYPRVVDALRLRQASLRPNTSLDVLRVQFLLRHRLHLSSDIASKVMDEAEYWMHFNATRLQQDHAFTVDQSSPQMPYVSLRVLGTLTSKVRRIIFTTVSHDQGWSSEPQNHGTYRFSWTWHEAAVSHPEADDVFYNNRTIQTNVHASSEWHAHENTWDYQDVTPGIAEWLEQISAGDSIHVIPRAQFPGWVHYVARISVDVYISA